jgi:hypothetical protein
VIEAVYATLALSISSAKFRGEEKLGCCVVVVVVVAEGSFF